MPNLHSEQTEIHVNHNWTYADAAARIAATGFTTDDIGKDAWQQSDDTFWRLVDNSPITWKKLTPSSQSDSLNIPTHTDTTWYTVLTIPTTTDRNITLDVIVSGHSDDVAAAAWSYQMLAYAENDGGSLTTGNNTPEIIVEYDAAYDVQIATSGTDALIQVRRNGGVDYDIDWAVMAQIAAF